MKYLKLLFAILFITVLINSCGPNEPGDPPELIPISGYQYDIPWPSLADSPWPMEHGNPQSSGRSKFAGPEIGQIDFELKSVNVTSGISIGSDSTIYFLSNYPNYGLYAVGPNGNVKWVNKEIVNNQDMVSTPIIANDGTIYVAGGLSHNFYALNPDGSVKWIFEADMSIYFRGISIGLNGTLYFVDRSQTLYAVNNDGNLNWKLHNSNFGWGVGSTIVFSPDGNTIYLSGRNPTLFSIDIKTQSIKWQFGQFYGSGGAVVNSQNHIYIQSIVDSINNGKPSVYCLNPDGSIRWSYTHGNKNFFEPLAYFEGTIDRFGNYYFAYDTLYSLDYYGKLRWKKDLQGYHQSPLVCDITGCLYFSIEDESRSRIKEFASFDNNGNVLWTLSALPELENGFSPAIGFNKDIYFPIFESNVMIKIN